MSGSPSFGRGRKLRIGATVALTVLVAVVVWLLLNFVTTRPRLRTTLDFSRGARFTVSDATKAMIQELREKELTLEIDTYFRHPQDDYVRAIGGIQQRVIDLTEDLLRRLEYYGGDRVKVTKHDIYREITAQRAQALGLTAEALNSITLALGPRKRRLGLLTEMADIEIPELGQRQPGQMAQPILRGYKGEEAVASALSGLLREGKLVAYWLTGHYEAEPSGVAGTSASLLARRMIDSGFENRRLDLSREPAIPDDCSLLLILGPEDVIRESQRGLIQAYLRNGGRVLMTAHYLTDRIGEQVDFSKLLDPFGVAIGDRWLFTASSDPRDPSNFRFGPLSERARVLIHRGLNGGHPVTARLRQQGRYVELHRARALRLMDPMPDGVLGEYLLSTHPKAWELAVQPGTRPSMAIPSEEQLGTRHVGASVEVRATSEGGRKGRLVVISGMAFQNGGDPVVGGNSLIEANSLFGLYLVNWLVREESLVTVPSDQRRSRTMDVPAADLARLRGALVWGLPGLFLVLSLFVLFWRRRS